MIADPLSKLPRLAATRQRSAQIRAGTIESTFSLSLVGKKAQFKKK
jgi:hypothetical protein